MTVNYVFNKFFFDFIKDVKHVSPEVRKMLKIYKVVDMNDTKHMTRFKEIFQKVKEVILTQNDIFQNTDMQECEIFENMTLSQLLVDCKDESDKKKVQNHIYILSMLIIVDESESETDKLLDLTLKAIKHVSSDEEFNNVTSNILDDDIQNLLEKFKSNNSFDFSSLENSQFGKLAHELAEDIDLTGLTCDEPQDIMKMMGKLDIGSICSKVSSKISDKMSKGELNTNDLMKEATRYTQMFAGNNNPFFEDMMRNLGKQNNSETKDRLRKKLENKK